MTPHDDGEKEMAVQSNSDQETSTMGGHKSKQKNGGILGNRSNKKENSCTSVSRIWPVFIKSLSVRPSCGFFTR